MPRTVLIVSSGRTGTQFLAHYFDGNFEDVVARHEPAPRALVRIACNAHAAGALPRASLVRLLRRGKARRIDPLAAPLYVESNPFLWGAVDVFDEVYDEPIVVHVVRDPRDQVRSSLNHGTSKGWKGIANRWLPYWYPQPAGGAGPRGDASWLARAAGVWAVVNQRLRDEGARCRHYRVMRYEDLFDETLSGLRDLCALLGLEFRGAGSPVDPTRRINAGRLAVMHGWESWTDHECEQIARISSPLMEEYGYGREPEWLARVSPRSGSGS